MGEALLERTQLQALLEYCSISVQSAMLEAAGATIRSGFWEELACGQHCQSEVRMQCMKPRTDFGLSWYLGVLCFDLAFQ